MRSFRGWRRCPLPNLRWFYPGDSGRRIEVPTLSGQKALKIPRGIESGDVLRLKGEGFPRLRSSGRGDQVVQVLVRTPKNLTKRQEELLKEFEQINRKKDKEEEGGWKK
jgi:molecular chaperone DnaJ